MSSHLANTGRTKDKVLAPREHGEWVCIPPLSEALALARRNAERLHDQTLLIAGHSLATLRFEARLQLLERVLEIAEAWELPQPSIYGMGPWIVTGHQPVLAHPGVWVKNAAAAALIKRAGGIGLNLIVDSDLVESTSLAVPTGTQEHPVVQLVPFDVGQPVGPWEEAVVQNLAMLHRFADEVCPLLECWGYTPLLRDYWKPVCRSQLTGLTQLLTQARVLDEARRGWQNLEFPLSAVCQLDVFFLLLWQLAADAGRFRDAYNKAVQDYRTQHRIRSRTHPVPELGQRGDLIELPFWVWKAGSRQRRGLWVSTVGNSISLTNGTEVIAQIDRLTPASARRLNEQLGVWKIRTRALTTTLFARLFLADLFIHGIGGAKYDEITDRLLEDYFGIHPPAYLTLTATLHLPLPQYPDPQPERQQLLRFLRDLRFNPERALQLPETHPLVQRRGDLVARKQGEYVAGLSHGECAFRRPANRALHQEFQSLNTVLREQATNFSRQTTARLLELDRQLAANEVLRNREFAAVLHPPEALSALFAKVFEAVSI